MAPITDPVAAAVVSGAEVGSGRIADAAAAAAAGAAADLMPDPLAAAQGGPTTARMTGRAAPADAVPHAESG